MSTDPLDTLKAQYAAAGQVKVAKGYAGAQHFAAIERAEFRMRCLELAEKCWNDPAVRSQKLSIYDLADRFLDYVVVGIAKTGGESPDDINEETGNPFMTSQPGAPLQRGPVDKSETLNIPETVSPEPAKSEFTPPAAASFDST
jgi:hypothetical protein